ncbi:hypothetical protein [Ferrimonas sp.]|uniref:hypothetical protein n=1 Tax=Ferrimonas sp. TaxID=2080861 RepID=UPI003A94B53E
MIEVLDFLPSPVDEREVFMSTFSTAVTALVHLILTLTFALAAVMVWLWLVKWRFDAPESFTDKDIDADLHHH